MIFFLYGPDTYRSHHKLTELKEKFLKDVDESSLNLTFIDGAKMKVEEFNSAIATPPFLARKRMIVVSGLLGQNKNKEVGRQVIEVLEKENLTKDNIIVFWEPGEPDERTVLFKRLNKEKYAQRFDPLRDSDLRNWIHLETKRRGGAISSEAIVKLSEMVGNDLWTVNSEIDKLIAFKNKKTIEADDVVTLVKSKFDDNIFNFIDAIANKNHRLAHKLLDDQLNSGANELYLLSMLIRQFRILLLIKDLGSTNKQQIASQLKIHPFVAQKALAQIRNFSLDKLKNIYSLLLETDIKIKTSYADSVVLFDLLLAKIMS
ncbi:MAG: DNA polymerase III subunit delta [Patescibacteria group bacterium]|jgi:DNA polymerase-3 subunit delta